MKKNILVLIIGILVIIGAALYYYTSGAMGTAGLGQSGTGEWKPYTEEDFDFSISHPSDWVIEDGLNAERCCLVLAHWVTASTTALNASGTPVDAVKATELIKLQFGYYDRDIEDPYKAASTTSRVKLGKNEWTVGTTTQGVEFFLLPRDGKTGVGIAQFNYLETPDQDRATALKIISSLKLLPFTAPTPASTATTSDTKGSR